MKPLSSALIVACGTAILIASSVREAMNRDALFNIGLLVVVLGLVGWAFATKAPPGHITTHLTIANS